MRHALVLAEQHRPHPNPRVGSVVVAINGAVVGEGSHKSPGEDHAEIAALEAAGAAAEGATVYVTLEPCSHQGRTPPCVEAIIGSGASKVVIGAGDPDPRVSGEGVRLLREAGIQVVEGVLSHRARAIDPGYFHHRETGLPLVTLKYAMTLDGAAAASDSTSQWITSEEAREDAHRLRASSDAVVVGSGTVRTDDPRLDVRLPGFEGAQPRPVVVVGQGGLPSSSRIWSRDPLVIAASEIDIPSGELLVVEGQNGRPDPVAACQALAGLGLLEVLLEGGSTVAAAWWAAGVISVGVVYLGARLGGGRGIPPLDGVFETIDEATSVSITGARSLGEDLRIDFERIYVCSQG